MSKSDLCVRSVLLLAKLIRKSGSSITKINFFSACGAKIFLIAVSFLICPFTSIAPTLKSVGAMCLERSII